MTSPKRSPDLKQGEKCRKFDLGVNGVVDSGSMFFKKRYGKAKSQNCH